MPAYWWKCQACGKKAEFSEVCNSRSMAYFVWDELLHSSWDQGCLVKQCPHCAKKEARITYEFPRKRKEKEVLTLVRAVGLDPFNDRYVPMMWETIPDSEPDKRWFDFKYVYGRSVFGLNKPAVFSRKGLADLFDLYRKMSGESSFP